MRRSEINAIMVKAMRFLEAQKFQLPPFAYWTPEDWKKAGHEADEIRGNSLGWDITDFGKGDFDNFGLFLFTLRNGNLENPNDQKPYAEKVMIVQEGQTTPMHFHWTKMEDIINRGGGNLLIQVYNATPEDELAETPVQASCDGVVRTVAAGETLTFAPGHSITLLPRMYHTFWAEPGKGTVLIGEVSSVNDDRTDNRFLEPLGRFADIEEDEPPLHLLCNEYAEAQ